MNKKLNIGDYVRTKDDLGIQQICKIKKTYSTNDFFFTDYGYWDIENIIKSSPNIIDLIEVGDLIKLYSTKQIQQVLAINDEEIDLTDYVFYDLKNSNVVEEIEWVITREQIEQMKYKVGE